MNILILETVWEIVWNAAWDANDDASAKVAEDLLAAYNTLEDVITALGDDGDDD